MLGNRKEKAITAILGPTSTGVGVQPQEKDSELYAIAARLISAIHAKNEVETVHFLETLIKGLEQPDEEASNLLMGD